MLLITETGYSFATVVKFTKFMLMAWLSMHTVVASVRLECVQLKRAVVLPYQCPQAVTGISVAIEKLIMIVTHTHVSDLEKEEK